MTCFDALVDASVYHTSSNVNFAAAPPSDWVSSNRYQESKGISSAHIPCRGSLIKMEPVFAFTTTRLDVTAAVQAWVGGRSSQLLVHNEHATRSLTCASNRHANPAFRPFLTVSFTSGTSLGTPLSAFTGCAQTGSCNTSLMLCRALRAYPVRFAFTHQRK